VREISPEPEERHVKRLCTRIEEERRALELRSMLERNRHYKGEPDGAGLHHGRLGPPCTPRLAGSHVTMNSHHAAQVRSGILGRSAESPTVSDY
jgi:hypothetical protein